MKKGLYLGAALAVTLFSCSKDDNGYEGNTAQLKIKYSDLTTTTNYLTTFKGADNNSSVDFSGQASRIAMMKELDAYMKTGLTANVDAQKMKDMFENKNNAFAAAALNTSGKDIISKTAQSFSVTAGDLEKNQFKTWMDALAATSASHGQTASAGTAGLLDSKYLVDAKGFEYGQFIQKGLMGAMMMDQINNIYLAEEKQNADNKTVVTGKNYTQLEHHWDEAYGYLTQNEVYPKADPATAGKYLETYLGSYVRQVTPAEGGVNGADVFKAFLVGRAAIVNNDNGTRTNQIAYIRTNIEKSIAIVAVSYLNKTKTATTSGAKFHSLSEGTGFIYSLRYGYNAKINATQSNQLLSQLMGKTNGFWDLTNADIDAVRDVIAGAFGINKEVVVNH